MEYCQEKSNNYGLAGFLNTGNTCYLNAVLQTISNIPLLREYITHREYQLQLVENIRNDTQNLEIVNNFDDITELFKNKLSYQLERLLRAIWKNNDIFPVYKPTSFRNLLIKEFESFNNNIQQDAQECFTALFDILEKEIGCSINIEPTLTNNEQLIYAMFDEHVNLIESEKDEFIRNQKKATYRLLEDEYPQYVKRYVQLINLKQRYKRKHSIIDDLFSVGYLITSICPNCNYKSPKYDAEFMITLEIPTVELSEDAITQKMKTIVFPFEMQAKIQKQNEEHNEKQSISHNEISVRFPSDDFNLCNIFDTNKHELRRRDSSKFNLQSIFEDNEPFDIQTECEYISEKSDDLNIIFENDSDDDKDDFDAFLDDDDDDDTNIIMPRQISNNFLTHNDLANSRLEQMRRTRAIQELTSNFKYNLYDCLDRHFEQTHVEGRRCDYCNECNNTPRLTKLLNVSKYLVIHLKRFAYDYLTEQSTKKAEFIDFPMVLDIERYIDSDLLPHLKTNTKYELINVINHIGVYGAGHYYAYCKNSHDNNWYCFNDESCGKIDNVISANAYMLVYQQLD